MFSRQALIRLLLALLMWPAVSTVAHAQLGYGRPNDRPTFSPYLNLLRRGRGGAAYNYFGIVRPQIQLMEQNQQLAQGLTQLYAADVAASNPGAGLGGPVQMGITGHPVVFMSFDGGGGGGIGGATLGGGSFGGGGLGGGFAGAFSEGDSGFGTGGLAGGGFSPGGGISVGPGFQQGGFQAIPSTGHPATFSDGPGGSIGFGEN